jgi:hypothetical protein
MLRQGIDHDGPTPRLLLLAVRDEASATMSLGCCWMTKRAATRPLGGGKMGKHRAVRSAVYCFSSLCFWQPPVLSGKANNAASEAALRSGRFGRIGGTDV